MSSSFLKRGSEAATSAAEEASAKSKNQFIRFFVKNDGDARRVRFLDGDDEKNEPIVFVEHTLQRTKKFGNKVRTVWENYTCLASAGQECPICSPDHAATTKYAYTILDRDGYETKDGKVERDVKKLYVIGTKQYKALLNFKKRKGSLTAQDVTIVRNGTGQQTTYSYEAEEKSKLVLDETAKNREGFDLKPLDYEELLKPISREQALALVRGITEPAQAEEVEDNEEAEEIPY